MTQYQIDDVSGFTGKNTFIEFLCVIDGKKLVNEENKKNLVESL